NTDGDVAFNKKEPEFDEKKSESEVNVSPSSSAQSKKHDDKTKSEAKGKSPVESFTRYRNLSVEFEDFSDNSINEVNVAGTLVPTVGKISPNSTNTFSAVVPSNAAASPTHGKSSCINASQLPDDLDMPELEHITYSDDEDDVGAEADFNNLETSITVSPIPTIRVHKDHPVTQIIGDLSSATQPRSMARVAKDQGVLSHMFNDDFHTCMFTFFLSQDEPKREEKIDYEEVFAPVARIEVIRLFLAYASFMGFMVYQMDVKSAFLYGTIEEEDYVCQPLGFEDPDYPNKVYKVVKALSGLHQAPRACQDKYVAEILRKFGLSERKSASTPIDAEKPFLKDSNSEDVDVHTYRSMIGSLMYLTSSRPDIIFAVCACARFQVTPKLSHLNAVKRIFRYLKGKRHLGLWYPKDSPFDLVAYSDSDYAVVATSLTEAKFIAAASGCAQVLWMQNQLLGYGSMIGSLMYLTSSRPDIIFAVCACARFQVTPKASHLHAVKRIFRYLKGKPHLGLWYPKDSPFDLVAYSESDYAGASLDRKSTTGGVNTPRCDKDRLELIELTVFLFPKVEKVGVELWTTVAVKKVNDVKRLQALMDKKKVVVTETTIRDALRLNDAEGVECLSNEEIITELARMGYEKPSTKLTFYKAFFSSQKQVGDVSTHTTKYTSPALTHNVFANIRRVGKGFSEVKTPLFEGMVVAQEVSEGVANEVHDEGVPAAGVATEGVVSAANDKVPTADEEPSIPSPTPPTPPPQPSHDIPSTSYVQPTLPQSPQVQSQSPQGRMIADMDADADVPVPAATTAATPALTDAPSRRTKGVVIRDREESTTTTSTSIHSEAKSKDKGKRILRKRKKRQKLEVEIKELKRHLQIVPNEDDDVYAEATPLACKIPVVDYDIYNQNNKPYYKIKRANERFATAKPKNFSDDFLLTTLGVMFEKPDIHAQIWKNQRSVYGQAKVKSWKLLESCGVQIITFTTTELILLVEKRYPLTRFTLDQMLNNVRLEVDEESEVSLELLRFIRQQHQEGAQLE
nr:hypothetical protein [Tanacetum cinerariifolium]